MYGSIHPCYSAGKQYIEELGWWLVPIRGVGKNGDGKAPLYKGWTAFRPDVAHLHAVLEYRADAGIGVHLQGSGLIDLEGDTEQGEAILEQVCQGFEFPCYRSRKSKHRLFRSHEAVSYLKIADLGIEIRAGRNQSVLPPSVVVGEERTQYEWLVSPFDCPIPPLPDRILAFYLKHAADPKNDGEPRPHQQSKPRFPYRDDRDYVLRYFDLLKEAKDAGVEFLFETPDRNGNVPCYVPAELRGGKEDEHPSGVFNVFNGVLRDFGTGKNHRFFNMLAAITGQPWQDIFDRYEAQAAPLSGRPHSRRISHPVPMLTEETKMSLAEARTTLMRYYQEQLSRNPTPKVIHVIKGQPGLGKTHGMCKALAETRRKAIILTPENGLADRHLSLLQHPGGVAAARMPVLRETKCPYPDQYEATRRRGFSPSQSYPCRKCEIGLKNCPYRLGFSSLKNADQLCAAVIYHTHDGFYQSYGNPERPLVVFDENCVDQLLEPVSHSIDQWRAWAEMLRRWEKDKDYHGHPHAKMLFALVEWLDKIAQEFLTALDAKFVPYPVPKELQNPDLQKMEALLKWCDKAAYHADNRSVHNLYNAAFYLLTHPDAAIVLERINKASEDIVVVRFRKNNPLPEDREVFLLDATANEELIRAIAPGWDIRVWECPPIEQKGRVIQIMDYDVSRNRIRKDVARHEPQNPSWMAQVLDHILARHGPAPIITVKDVAEKPEADILGKVKHRDRITEVHNFPCRGYDIDTSTLIVLGTPYKDEAVIWELAMAIWGFGGLPRTEYSHRKRENGYFIARTMCYDEPHLKPIEEFVISADLVQAIGRARPLQNAATVFVITNAPLPDWEVEQFMASELFDLRTPLRKDAADNYTIVCEQITRMLEQDIRLTFDQVMDACKLPRRTAQRYWQRFKEENQGSLIIEHGKIRKRVADS